MKTGFAKNNVVEWGELGQQIPRGYCGLITCLCPLDLLWGFLYFKNVGRAPELDLFNSFLNRSRKYVQ